MADGFELVALAGGIYSLRARANGQTFHPVVGPVAEAEAIHVGGARLVERANALPPGETFVIWDVGLGAAANAITAIRALSTGGTRTGEIEIHSFDATYGPLDFALENRLALGYPCGYEPEIETLRREGSALVPLINSGTVRWQAHLGDFPSRLASEEKLPAPHAVFYDPYSPGVNLEMWMLETFNALHVRLRPEAPCLLTTYTRSTAVRVTLLLAGFFVGVGGATGEKDETHRRHQRRRAVGTPTRGFLAGKKGVRLDERGSIARRVARRRARADQRGGFRDVARAWAVSRIVGQFAFRL